MPRQHAAYVDEMLSVVCDCGRPLGRVLGNGRVTKLPPCRTCRMFGPEIGGRIKAFLARIVRPRRGAAPEE
jgi:hypothetical protein